MAKQRVGTLAEFFAAAPKAGDDFNPEGIIRNAEDLTRTLRGIIEHSEVPPQYVAGVLHLLAAEFDHGGSNETQTEEG